MPSMTSQQFIEAYEHVLEQDFTSLDGTPATFAEGHPKAWGEEGRHLRFDKKISDMVLSPDGCLLAVAVGDSVELFACPDLELRRTISVDGLGKIIFSPDGKVLLSTSSSRDMQRRGVSLIRLWDIDAELAREDTEGQNVFGKAAAGALEIATGLLKVDAGWSEEDVAAESPRLLSDLESLLRVSQQRLDAHHGRGLSGSIHSYNSQECSPFSPDGRSLLYNLERNVDALWDIQSESELFRMQHSDFIMWSGFSSDGRTIGTSSWDKTVKLWDAKDGTLLHTLEGSQNQCWTARFSPDDKYIAMGSGDKKIHIWSTDSGECVRVLEGFTQWVRSIDWSADGRYMAAGAAGGTVRVFDTSDGSCLHWWQIAKGDFRQSFMEIGGVRFLNVNGDLTLAFPLNDGRLVLYNLVGNVKSEIVPHAERDKVYGSGKFVLLNDGKTLLTGDTDNTLRVWDL